MANTNTNQLLARALFFCLLLSKRLYDILREQAVTQRERHLASINEARDVTRTFRQRHVRTQDQDNRPLSQPRLRNYSHCIRRLYYNRNVKSTFSLNQLRHGVPSDPTTCFVSSHLVYTCDCRFSCLWPYALVA